MQWLAICGKLSGSESGFDGVSIETPGRLSDMLGELRNRGGRAGQARLQSSLIRRSRPIVFVSLERPHCYWLRLRRLELLMAVLGHAQSQRCKRCSSYIPSLGGLAVCESFPRGGDSYYYFPL